MNQKYIFEKKVWDNFKEHISENHKIFLLLDYDGTIAPIKRHHNLAVLPKQTKKIIEQISRHKNIKVAIVSGRSLSYIRQAVNINNLLYVANHGYQIYYKNKTWTHPFTKRTKTILKKLIPILSKALSFTKGISIEDKGLTLSVHYRNVRRKNLNEILKIIKNVIHPLQNIIILTTGKKVVEVRPNVQWDKGHAVLKILKLMKATNKSTIIYIGDDKTDEDAFKQLAENAFTIRVRKNKSSYAKFYVNSTSDVIKLLSFINLRKPV